ncbi:MAG: hypothetical protein ACNYPE_01705 [Candidatus Azotimanducaceae bacterium WSBS_2022_MAG_OTU7]
MKFIIVDSKTGKHRSFNANAFFFGVALVGLISIPAAAGYYVYRFGIGEIVLTGGMVAKWREVLDDQKDAVETIRGNTEHEASILRIAQLQAKIVRLDALGERLTKIGRLDKGRFDFHKAASDGWPRKKPGRSGGLSTTPAYIDLLDDLTKRH